MTRHETRRVKQWLGREGATEKKASKDRNRGGLPRRQDTTADRTPRRGTQRTYGNGGRTSGNHSPRLSDRDKALTSTGSTRQRPRQPTGAEEENQASAVAQMHTQDSPRARTTAVARAQKTPVHARRDPTGPARGTHTRPAMTGDAPEYHADRGEATARGDRETRLHRTRTSTISTGDEKARVTLIQPTPTPPSFGVCVWREA